MAKIHALGQYPLLHYSHVGVKNLRLDVRMRQLDGLDCSNHLIFCQWLAIGEHLICLPDALGQRDIRSNGFILSAAWLGNVSSSDC